MQEWASLLRDLGVNAGTTLLVLWWMTQKLIPALQKQNDSTLNMFRTELSAERDMHREELGKMFSSYSELAGAIRACPAKKG